MPAPRVGRGQACGVANGVEPATIAIEAKGHLSRRQPGKTGGGMAMGVGCQTCCCRCALKASADGMPPSESRG